MMMSIQRAAWQIALFGGLLSACSVFIPASAPTPLPAASPTPNAQHSATPIPTVEATPDNLESLTLWIPDVMMPSTSGEETTDPLNQQIAAFAEENDIAIEVRRKRVRELGGIMPTLRTAHDVAPGVLPDLTMLRRVDLLQAAQSELIQPMEGIIPSAVIGNLYPSALALGQVNNTLYGLPYALDIQHVVYAPNAVNLPDAAFSTYLAGQIPFTFPGGSDDGLTSVFLVQYLAAGGSINADGTLVLDAEALTAVLQFYEDAVADELVTPDVLDYTRSTAYRSGLGGDIAGAVVVSSDVYLGLNADETALAFSAIPTTSGVPTTALNGWMWVITTPNPSRQLIASAFLSWMMNPNRQGEYVRSLNMLPSQQSAFQRGYSEDYNTFVTEVMANARLPLSDTANGTVARAMQAALVAVINGEQSAAQATETVISHVTG